MLLVVLVGNIGTGKTTFRNKLKYEGRIIVCPDEYLGSIEEKGERMGTEIKEGLKSKKTIIIDGVNVDRRTRKYFLGFAEKVKYRSIIFDFGCGNYDTLLRRAKMRPDISFQEWETEHLQNQLDYEKPNKDEGFDKIIRMY